MTIITRVGFCEKCFLEKHPKTNQKFLVMGTTCGALKAQLALHNGRTGFTPHLYWLKKVTDNKVFYQRICAMEGCGVYSMEEDNKNWLVIDESKWSSWRATSLNNWNSLVLFKDTGFEI